MPQDVKPFILMISYAFCFVAMAIAERSSRSKGRIDDIGKHETLTEDQATYQA